MKSRVGGVLLFCAILGAFEASYASSITGTITGPDGLTPIPNAYVESANLTTRSWGPSTYADENGFYELSGLAAGTYHVSFREPYGSHAPEVYDNIPGLDMWNSGTDIVVGDEGTNAGINASLADGALMTGTVTGPDGLTPIPGIGVSVYLRSGWSWNNIGFVWTDGDGNYSCSGLAAGTYRVTFTDYDGNYVPEVYDNVPGNQYYSTGTDIVVAEASTVSSINASLSVASKITGTVTGPDGVTPVENVQVSACSWNGLWWSSDGYDWTDAGGHYEIGGLLAGTYRVRFYDASGHNYVDEAYSNAPSLDLGNDIALPSAATVSNIDASLDEYGSLTGVVVLADGITPAAGVEVRLIGTVNGVNRYTDTDVNGQYYFTSVRPGSYAVRTEPTADGDYLGQWYSGVLYVPGQNAPPGGATILAVDSGESEVDVDFELDPAARISGVVTGNSCSVVSGAVVKAKNGSYGLSYEALTDSSGAYELGGLLPGSYTIKAEVDSFQDEWWNNVTHEDFAGSFLVASGDDLVFDFDLALGQSPALVEVMSDPAGATVYLDYQPTTNVTPVVLNVGEVASHSVWMGGGIASHVITLKKAGRPRPAPRPVAAREAETVSMLFDMTSSSSGSVSIATAPDGATVFIDYADSADGVSPVIVGNLAPGSHVILLKKEGYLQPRPVVAGVQEGLTNEVTVPLVTNTASARIIADARSVPPDATIYVDYLPTTNVTDVVVDWMDPASHAGAGWSSASHTIMLRKNGFLPASPRYVSERTNETEMMLVHLILDSVSALDEDHDGLPDQWEDAYRLRELAPSQHGADDDPDHDGSPNSEEMGAGTNPLDGDSLFAVADGPALTVAQGQTVTLVFDTVPGRTYIVQCSDELKTSWTNISGSILATDYQTSYTTQIPGGTAHRFYRAIVLTP